MGILCLCPHAWNVKKGIKFPIVAPYLSRPKWSNDMARSWQLAETVQMGYRERERNKSVAIYASLFLMGVALTYVVCRTIDYVVLSISTF